ncbi:MAG TPA: zinc ribbon domain-containing protein [Symbiobacteriaceae bacterium]|nr:zinc ribbon domain-containing protein [Symbiobacteriaceae bacterium]
MVKRWFQEHLLLRRAALGLAIFVISLVAAILTDSHDERLRSARMGDVTSIVSAVPGDGPRSAAMAALMRQTAETPVPRDVVALIDSATGEALAAWPEVHLGKRPEQMMLSGGVYLPPLAALSGRHLLTLPRQTPVTVPAGYLPAAVYVQTTPVTPEIVLLTVTPKPVPTPLFWVAVALSGLALAGMIVYWVSVAWWVFVDARRRGQNALAWGVLALMTNLVGAAVYVAARPDTQPCHTCGSEVEATFSYCPYCGDQLHRTCNTCRTQIKPAWRYCPACGTASEESELEKD